MNLRGVLFTAIVLLIVGFASAQLVPSSIRITDCQINDSDATAACSEQVPIVCNVAITYPDQLISSVSYTVSGSPQPATRISGSNLNGTWQYIHTVTAGDDEAPISLDRVRATSSAGEQCSGTRDVQDQSDGCYVTFTGDRSIANTCVCDTSITASAVRPDNTVLYTVTPNSGCTDQTVTTYTDFADYCDPEWTAEYSACSADTPATTGTQTKTYYAANPSCCVQTKDDAGNVWYNHNTGSDCTPPIDHGTTQACTLDTRVSYQADEENTGAEVLATGFNPDANTKRTASLNSQYEPLVYDVDQDGKAEVIAFSGSSIVVYEDDMTLKSSNNLGTITGQPSFWGITETATETIFATYVSTNGKPRLVVPFYNTSGVQYVGLFEFSASGVPTQVNEVTFDTDGDTNPDTVSAGGVACYLSDCYVMQLASPNVQGYQITITDAGAMSLTNRDIGTTSQYFAKTKHVPSLTDDGQYVLWPIYYTETVGGNQYDRGAVIVSDTDLSNLLYIRYNLLPADDALSADPNRYQISYDLIGSVAVDGYDAYIAFTETVNRSGDIERELGVYKMELEQNPADFTGSDRTAQKRRVWLNNPTNSDEGISNVVIADSPAVTVHTQSPNVLQSQTQFDQPLSLFSYSTDPSFQVTSDDAEIFEQNGQWYVIYIDAANTVRIERIDGTEVYTYTTTGSTNTITDLYVDTVNDHLYIGRHADLGLGYGYGIVVRIDISSIASPQLDGTISASTSAVLYSSEYSQISGVYDGYLYGMWSSMDETSVYRVPVSQFSNANIEKIDSGYIGEAKHSLVAMQPDDIDTLDNATGIVLSGAYMYFDRDTGFPTPTEYQTLSNRVASAGSFNFDWSDPRYMTYTGGNAHKVRVTGWDPFTTTVATNGCEDFYPLVYNSDSFILGVILESSPTSGHSQYDILPELGYCDYSDEVSPDVNSLGIAVPYGSFTNNSGTYNFGMPNFGMRPNNNEYDGTATEYEIVFAGDFCNRRTTTCPPNTNFQDQYDFIAYTLDATTVQATDFTGASTRAVTFNDNFVALDQVTAGFTKRGFATVADWDDDGVLDIITPAGTYLLGTASYDEFFSGANGAGETAIPVDLNADTVLDLVTIMPGQVAINAWITSADATVLLEGDIAVNNFKCSSIPETSSVLATLMATAPNPDAVQVSIDKGDGSGFQSRTTADDGQYTLRYSEAGTYTARVQVRSVGSSEVASATCSVTIPDTVAPRSECSIGDDGEFMYTDSVSNHGWTITSGQVTPVGGYMVLDSQESVRYQLAGCTYEEMTFEARMQPGQLSSFRLLGEQSSTSIGFTFDTTNGVIRDASGGVLTAFENYDQLSVFRIVVDNAQGKVRLYEGGQLIGSKDLQSFVPSAVQFSSEMTVDYVRLTVSGDQLDTTSTGPGVVEGMNGDVTHLSGCERVASSLEYENVAQYCYSVDGEFGSGYCNYQELLKIASRYGDCTKEVYNYCVYEEYPRDQGIPASEVNGLSGATLCSNIIGTGGFWSKIVEPSVGSLWDLVTGNIVVLLIMVTLLFVGVPVWVARRR